MEGLRAAWLFYGCATPNPTAEQEPGVGEGGNLAPTLVLTAVTVPSSLDLATRVPRPATNPKLESTLAQLLVAYQQEGAAGAQAYAQAHRMAIEGSLVEVEILATTDQVASLTGAIEAQGGRVHGHRGT